MKVLVCGDREWNDQALVVRELKRLTNVEWVIEGGARGADLAGRVAAQTLGIAFMEFPAHWSQYGGSAGIRRNQEMLDRGQPDLVLAFHDHLEQSRGTKHMIEIAERAGVLVKHVQHAPR
ncbi:MAG: DUF2493 domain-containing protein [Patescibacteria group bacterium]|nr:DUF2493 domain-containing protein [Patescibacteria group bacterium]